MTAEPTRRGVLCGLAVALLAPGAVLAACSSDDGSDGSDDGGGAGKGGPGTGGAPASAPTSKAADEPEGAIVPVANVPVGGGVLALALGRQVLLVQPKAGTVEAFDPICPHQGFTVNPPQRGTIVCPGHGSTFDGTTGALKSGPATRGLTKVPVKISKGYVVAV